ncbi:MAG: [Fe-Fe] hydrogenase large subunit C-terminal domain-containing protein [Eubacteriales bacterium]
MINTSEILKTSIARCRDCYRCVRACPVNAIGVKGNQAYIDPDRCILCGTCVRECPQKAKIYRDDIQAVKALLKQGKVIASIAPSFAGVYGINKSTRLPAALRKLGFYKVEETSIGADAVAKASAEKIDAGKCGGVCSACPAVVSYIEKYMSDHTNILTTITSPMIAHGSIIKHRYADAKVVFIGPCIAKKGEASQEKYHGIVDAVLTFDELNRWLESEDIDLSILPESTFDGVGITRAAKLFALPGGMLETAGYDAQITNAAYVHTSGSENVKMILHAAINSDDMEVLEPLFCNGGCIGGPGISSELNIFQRKAAIMKYADKSNMYPKVVKDEFGVKLDTQFAPYKIKDTEITEQQILDVYEATGKMNSALRLDCGACGYANCKENAIAMIKGMAEAEMCLPYMRRLAEKRTDKILESSPNGIVILDENMAILSMNTSFKNFFSCTNSIVGRQISYLCDDRDYASISKGESLTKESIIKCYGKEFHQLSYYLPEEKQFVGIYVDISAVRSNEAKLQAMRTKTLEQVQKLLNHQVEMAQEMTKFLGESTAKSEALMEGLLDDES